MLFSFGGSGTNLKRRNHAQKTLNFSCNQTACNQWACLWRPLRQDKRRQQWIKQPELKTQTSMTSHWPAHYMYVFATWPRILRLRESFCGLGEASGQSKNGRGGKECASAGGQWKTKRDQFEATVKGGQKQDWGKPLLRKWIMWAQDQNWIGKRYNCTTCQFILGGTRQHETTLADGFLEMLLRKLLVACERSAYIHPRPWHESSEDTWRCLMHINTLYIPYVHIYIYMYSNIVVCFSWWTRHTTKATMEVMCLLRRVVVELNTPAERWLGILVPCIRPLVGG